MLPSVLSGPRRWVFARLLANGSIQSCIAVGLAVAINDVLSVQKPDQTELLVGGLSLSALAISLVILRALQRRDAEAFGLSYVHDLRTAVVKHMLSLDGRFRPPGLSTTLTRLTNDLLAVKNWLSYGIADLAVACLSISITVAYLSASQPWLALSAGVSVALVLLVSGVLVPPLRRSVLAARRQRGKLARSIGEKLSHHETIRHLRRSQRETDKVRDLSTELTRRLVRRGAWSGLLRHTSLAALPLTIIIHAISTGSFVPTPGGADGSTDVTWLLLLGTSLAQLQNVTRAIDYRTNYSPAIERIRRVMALPVMPEMMAAESNQTSRRKISALHAVAIVASDEQQPASYKIYPGDRILLSCRSDRARSQLLRVLACLDSPRSGRLLLDDVPIEDGTTIAQYKRLVRFVSTSLGFLPGTVKGNLRKCGLRDLELKSNLDLWIACGLPSDPQARRALLDCATRDGRTSSGSDIDARLRLAMAVAARPRILLIDDPALGNPCANLWSELLRIPHMRQCAIVLAAAEARSTVAATWTVWDLDVQTNPLQLAS